VHDLPSSYGGAAPASYPYLPCAWTEVVAPMLPSKRKMAVKLSYHTILRSNNSISWGILSTGQRKQLILTAVAAKTTDLQDFAFHPQPKIKKHFYNPHKTIFFDPFCICYLSYNSFYPFFIFYLSNNFFTLSLSFICRTTFLPFLYLLIVEQLLPILSSWPSSTLWLSHKYSQYQ